MGSSLAHKTKAARPPDTSRAMKSSLRQNEPRRIEHHKNRRHRAGYAQKTPRPLRRFPIDRVAAAPASQHGPVQLARAPARATRQNKRRLAAAGVAAMAGGRGRLQRRGQAALASAPEPQNEARAKRGGDVVDERRGEQPQDHAQMKADERTGDADEGAGQVAARGRAKARQPTARVAIEA